MAKDDTPKAEQKQTARLVGLGLLVLLLAVFIATNFETVTVTFIVKDVKTKLALGLLVSALVGFAVGWIVGRDRD